MIILCCVTQYEPVAILPAASSALCAAVMLILHSMIVCDVMPVCLPLCCCLSGGVGV
jgi:hypothetical protein